MALVAVEPSGGLITMMKLQLPHFGERMDPEEVEESDASEEGPPIEMSFERRGRDSEFTYRTKD